MIEVYFFLPSIARKVEFGFPNGVRRRFVTQKFEASQFIQKYNKIRQC